MPSVSLSSSVPAKTRSFLWNLIAVFKHPLKSHRFSLQIRIISEFPPATANCARLRPFPSPILITVPLSTRYLKHFAEPKNAANSHSVGLARKKSQLWFTTGLTIASIDTSPFSTTFANSSTLSSRTSSCQAHQFMESTPWHFLRSASSTCSACFFAPLFEDFSRHDLMKLSCSTVDFSRTSFQTWAS